MRPIFLIGYMGCGKTTLGEPLARVMGKRFIDLDHYILSGYIHETVYNVPGYEGGLKSNQQLELRIQTYDSIDERYVDDKNQDQDVLFKRDAKDITIRRTKR